MNKLPNLTGQIALVTGANRGIGLETVRQLALHGAKVILTARSFEKAVSAAKELANENVVPLALDVSNSAQIAGAVRHMESNFPKLDILVNNAGVQLEPEGWTASTAPTVSPAILRRTFDTNFFGLIELTQSLLPLLRKSEAARIVNLTSILGSLTLHSNPGSPIYNSKLLAYDASKTALNAFTIHLAHALADTPIKVNSAHPGWVKTEMGGEGAFLEIAEGAETTLWLATLPAEGPTGGYFHKGETLPW